MAKRPEYTRFLCRLSTLVFFIFFFSLLQLVKLSMEDLHGREPESVPDTSDYYELPIKRGFSSIFRKKSLPTNTLLIL